MIGVVFLAQSPPARSRPPTAGAVDRRLISSNIELPLYVREGVGTYMLDHEKSSFRTVVMEGLRALGIDIEDEDMIPERAMRTPRKRVMRETDTPATRLATSIRLPRYVRLRAEEYLLHSPEMRFRHLVMAGFRKLGIEIDKADLVTERQNVVAKASASAARG